jgi:hypothetical protein
MKSQQQCIDQYLRPSLDGLYGGSFSEVVMNPSQTKYTFPCPFCSSLRKSERLRKKSDSCFYPIEGNYKYLFICQSQGTIECFHGIQFPEFLKRYDLSGSLLKRYKKMRNGWEDPDVTGFDFRPHF